MEKQYAFLALFEGNLDLYLCGRRWYVEKPPLMSLASFNLYFICELTRTNLDKQPPNSCPLNPVGPATELTFLLSFFT